MARTQTFVVFAYGSNMLTTRLQERCSSARALGTAELRGYALRWHKRSRTDGSGKCDVVESAAAGAVVFGVLYEIALHEKRALDVAEGLGHGYEAKSVGVVFEGTKRAPLLYYATDIEPSLRPYAWYKAFVVAGAREHGLPAKYIDRLEATEATEDPDRERDARNRKILTAAVQT